MPSWTLPRMVLHDGAVETLKWCGLAVMTVDHAHKYGLIPAVPGLYEAGRLAMPLFGFVLAYNLARTPQAGRAVYLRVLGRLLVCGAVASIPFIALGGLGFGWWPLNSMGMLAVAVCIMYLIEQRGPYWKLSASLVFLLGGSLVEFWWPGVAICVGAWLYCKQPSWGALLLWIGATASLTLINDNWWACASLGLIAGAAWAVTLPLPRASRFFYLYYPAHLAVLLLLGFKIEEMP